MPQKPGIRDLYPKANLGIYERFHLRNFNLIKHWDYTRAYVTQTCLFGHKEIETVTRKANIIAKINEQHESNCGKHQFQSSISAEKCKFLRKDSPQLEKHTCSLKGNVVYLEGDLVSIANTHSNNSECSLHLNIGSSTSEHLKFKNEGQNSQYTQFDGPVSRKSLFFQQKIFPLHSTMYSVDDNGRDVVQPTLFNVRHDIANMEQLSTCNNISQALSKSSSPSNYKGIYGGLRRYSSNQTGYKVEGESNLMKHHGAESSHRDSKSNKCRHISYQMSVLSLKSIHTRKKTYNCSEYGKASNQSSELVRQQTIQNSQKENQRKIHRKFFSTSSDLSRHRKIHA